MAECRSYQGGSRICADGFVQTFACWGDTKCHGCGRPSEKSTPHCMREELPPHFVDDSGKPRYYREPDRADIECQIKQTHECAETAKGLAAELSEARALLSGGEDGGKKNG